MNSPKVLRFPPLHRQAGTGEMSVALPLVPETVTFRSSFMLPGLDRPHPPGTYELRETRRRLDVSWDAYQISLSIILVQGGTTQALDVERADLDIALAADLAARG
jgi:hypothetical protein